MIDHCINAYPKAKMVNIIVFPKGAAGSINVSFSIDSKEQGILLADQIRNATLDVWPEEGKKDGSD